MFLLSRNYLTKEIIESELCIRARRLCKNRMGEVKWTVLVVVIAVIVVLRQRGRSKKQRDEREVRRR